MYDSFNSMIDELYDNQQLYQFCYVEGFKTKCFCSPIGDNLIYSDGGLQNGVNFSLDLHVSQLDRIPNEGDKVIFREKTYKIASTELDSVGACLKIYLISTSKGS